MADREDVARLASRATSQNGSLASLGTPRSARSTRSLKSIKSSNSSFGRGTEGGSERLAVLRGDNDVIDGGDADDDDEYDIMMRMDEDDDDDDADMMDEIMGSLGEESSRGEGGEDIDSVFSGGIETDDTEGGRSKEGVAARGRKLQEEEDVMMKMAQDILAKSGRSPTATKESSRAALHSTEGGDEAAVGTEGRGEAQIAKPGDGGGEKGRESDASNGPEQDEEGYEMTYESDHGRRRKEDDIGDVDSHYDDDFDTGVIGARGGEIGFATLDSGLTSARARKEGQNSSTAPAGIAVGDGATCRGRVRRGSRGSSIDDETRLHHERKQEQQRQQEQLMATQVGGVYGSGWVNRDDKVVIKAKGISFTYSQAKLFGLTGEATRRVDGSQQNDSGRRSNSARGGSGDGADDNASVVLKVSTLLRQREKQEQQHKASKAFSKERMEALATPAKRGVENVTPATRPLTAQEKRECTFKPVRSRKALAAMRNPACGYDFVHEDKDADAGGGHSKTNKWGIPEDPRDKFLCRMEAMLQTSRGAKERRIAEAEYEDRLDKLVCPQCGAQQAYDEWAHKKTMCPNCVVAYCKGKVSSGMAWLAQNERYQERSEQQRAKLQRDVMAEKMATKVKESRLQYMLKEKAAGHLGFLNRMLVDVRTRDQQRQDAELQVGADHTFTPHFSTPKGETEVMAAAAERRRSSAAVERRRSERDARQEEEGAGHKGGGGGGGGGGAGGWRRKGKMSKRPVSTAGGALQNGGGGRRRSSSSGGGGRTGVASTSKRKKSGSRPGGGARSKDGFVAAESDRPSSSRQGKASTMSAAMELRAPTEKEFESLLT